MLTVAGEDMGSRYTILTSALKSGGVWPSDGISTQPTMRTAARIAPGRTLEARDLNMFFDLLRKSDRVYYFVEKYMGVPTGGTL